MVNLTFNYFELLVILPTTIKYLRVVNSKGLTVFSETYTESKNPFFKENNNDLEFIVNSLYADLQLNFPSKIKLRRVEEVQNVPKGLYCYFFIEHYDLFIFFSTQKDMTDYTSLSKVTEAIRKRKEDRAFFKGIVVSDFDDVQGPVPIFNASELEDDFLAVLAVQGTTVLGMGMESMPSNIVGPVPIPANPELSALIRGFQRPAPSSDDPRIQKGGRPTMIFMIMDSSITLHKETLDFIDSFLTQWIYSDAIKEFLDEEDLEQMSIDLEQLIILALDLIHLRDVQTIHLRELVKFYASENMILKQEIAHLRAKISGKSSTRVKKTTKKRKTNKKATTP